MTRAQSISLVAAAGLLLSLFACGDDPVTPMRDVETVEVVHGPTGATFEALSWTDPPESEVTVREEIGADGGTIRVPDLGVTLRFPENAVVDPAAPPDGDPAGGPGGADGDDAVLVTVRAHGGGAVSLGFGPHGIGFRRPVRLEIDLARTSARGSDATLDDLVAVYYEGEPTGSVHGRELLPVRVRGGTLVVELRHFSGYLLASG